MLAVLSLGTAVLIAGQVAISPLLPTIVAEFSLSSTEAGTALTLMWFVAACAMYPGGRLSDQLSRRLILLTAFIFSSLGLSFLALSPSFIVFVLGLAILGIGIGLFEPVSMATVSDLYTETQGRAYGIISASFSVGYVAASVLALGGLALGSWRYSFIPAIVLVVFAGILVHRWAEGSYLITPVSMKPKTAIYRVVKTSKLQIHLAVLCLHMFVMQGSIAFIPTMLQLESGFTAMGATLAFTSIFFVGLLFNPLIGTLGDQVGHMKVGLSLPIIGAAGLLITLLASNSLITVTGLIIFGVGLLTFWPVITAELISGLAIDTLGGDYGIMRATFFAVGSFGPAFVGFFGEQFSFTIAFNSLIGCFLLNGILVYQLNRIS